MVKHQSTATGQREQLYPGVCCVTGVRKGIAGRHSDVRFFDVPNETYVAGHRTGTIAAWELVRASRNGLDDVFYCSITAAVEAVQECQSSSTTDLDRCGAAYGFLEMIDRVLSAASRKTDIDDVFIEELKIDESRHEERLQELRAKNAALIAEMIAPQQAVHHG
jgi:hypothetical protein